MGGSSRSSLWHRRPAWLAAVGLALLAGRVAFADEFSRIVGPPLFDVPTRNASAGTARLSVRSIEAMPEVVRGERAAFIILPTDEGNLAKLLVSPGLRRQAGAGRKGELAPVLQIERFETIDGGDRQARKARGRDVLLFDGFAFDLDTGQIVPPGFGGDIRFQLKGPDGPELTALGNGKLFPIDRPIALPAAGPGQPSPGPAVVPADFNGRYTLVANGQTSGALELSVDPGGEVSGRFRSDRNGSVYPVTGKVAADLPRRIEFEIKFPRTRQNYEGLLWTEDKNVFAGTARIVEHPYSFVAVREGAALVPESLEASSPPRPPSVISASTRVVGLEAVEDRYTIDGRNCSSDELKAALAAAVKQQAGTGVLVRAAPNLPYHRVERAIRLIRAAGIGCIRLAAEAPE
ncbi:MAG: ExbD/TolR family protein [Isosphaeraceae bacterium]